MTICIFAIWSPCMWTKLGQTLDSRKSKVCPPFVHEPFSIKNYGMSQYSLLGQILDKYQTHVQLMASCCQLLKPIANGPPTTHLWSTHGPPTAHSRPIKTSCRQSMDKCRTKFGMSAPPMSAPIINLEITTT